MTDAQFNKTLARTMFKLRMFTAEVLKAQYKPNTAIPAARVSRQNNNTIVEYNPDYFMALPNDELRASALTHEHLHPMLKHHMRMKDWLNKHPNTPMILMQQAADYEVNAMLMDMGMPLMKDWYYDNKYHGLAFEEILGKLMKEQEQEEQEDGNDEASEDGGSQGEDGGAPSTGDSGGEDSPDDTGDGGDTAEDQRCDDNNPMGDGEDQSDGDQGSGGDPEPNTEPADIEPFKPQSIQEAQQEQESCERSFIAACVEAQMAGSLPACMERILKELTAPKIDWRIILQDFMTQLYPEDYSYRRPKQLFDCMLPTMDGNRTPEFVFAIDTSGSVTEDELKQFASELLTAVEIMKPSRLHILWFDTQVYPQVFDDIPQLHELKPQGGGGTDYRPIGEYVKDNIDDISGIVVLTDGECSKYFDEPDFPVLWAITKDGSSYWYHEPPFGQVLKIPDLT